MRDRLEKKNRSQQGIARARMLLKRDLFWLPGFPLAVVQRQKARQSSGGDEGHLRWCCVPWGRAGEINTIVIDRELLRRSELTARKLRIRFQRAILKLIENPDEWFANFDELLRYLKMIVHDSASPIALNNLPSSLQKTKRRKNRWRRLEISFPDLSPLFSGIRFLELTSRQEQKNEVLSWLENAAPELIKLHGFQNSYLNENGPAAEQLPEDVKLQIILSCMYQNYPSHKTLVQIIKLLTHPSLRELETSDPTQTVLHIANGLKRQPPNSQRPKTEKKNSTFQPKMCSTNILECLDALLPTQTKDRRNILGCLEGLGNDGFLLWAEKFYQMLNNESRRLNSLSPSIPIKEFHKSLTNKKLRKSWNQQVEANLPNKEDWQWLPHFSKFLQRLPKLDSRICGTATEWLDVMQSDWKCGHALLMIVTRDVSNQQPHTHSKKVKNAISVLKEFTKLIRRKGLSGRLTELLFKPDTSVKKLPLATIVDPWLRVGVNPKYVFSEIKPFPPFSKMTALLEKMVYDKSFELNSKTKASLPAIVLAEPDTDQAVSLTENLNSQPTLESSVDVDEILAFRPFARTQKELAEFIVGSKISYWTVQALHPLAENEFVSQLVRHWIKEGSSNDMEEMAELVEAVHKAKLSCCPDIIEQPTLDWIERYPESLHPPLQRLSEISEESESIAAKILSSDFRNIDKLKEEVSYLRKRLQETELSENAHQYLRSRIESLRKSMISQKPLSSRRLQNLYLKLQQRFYVEIERKLASHLQHQIVQLLSNSGLHLPKSKLEDPLTLRLVIGLSTLSTHPKRQGLKLLQLALNNQPCPGIELESNRVFIERLNSKGVKTDPWLDSNRKQSVIPDNGPKYTIFFSTDPMDYLLMGHHFQTCLSPGDFNFFSTIANAVDINKQVLYGRQDDGKIIGRCLFALGDSGNLLVFNSYTHNSQDGFNNAVDEYAKCLASDMGVQRTTREKVSTLVAYSWYDDGAVNAAGNRLREEIEKFGALSWELSQEDNISEQKQNELIGMVRALLKITTLSDIYDHLQLFSNKFNRELLNRLVNEFDLSRCRPDQRIRLGLLAHRNGDSEIFDDILNGISRAELIRAFRRGRCGGGHGCEIFHSVGETRDVQEVLDRISVQTALAVLRATRRQGVRSDLEETDENRRRLLAFLHSKVGRQRLPEKLMAFD